MLKSIENIFITAIFCVLITLPLLGSILVEDQKASKIEKRNLKTVPQFPLTLGEITRFPTSFADYYADHFGFREFVYKEYVWLFSKISKNTLTNDVTFGQNDWLFLGSIKPGYKKYDDPMSDALNISRFSDGSMERFVESKVQIKNWLKEQGIEYVFFVAPNKHTIYFDQLPSYFEKQHKVSALDSVLEKLKQSGIATVDVRDELMALKKRKQVYYKYDTHWNHYAANQAQFSLSTTVSELFPGSVAPVLLNDEQFTEGVKNTGDLARFAKVGDITDIDPQPVFHGGCEPQREKHAEDQDPVRGVVTDSCDTGTLNALVFRDSFSEALEPYLSRYFASTTYVWKFADYELLKKYIALEKPNIVIEELVERKLPYTPKLFPVKTD